MLRSITERERVRFVMPFLKVMDPLHGTSLDEIVYLSSQNNQGNMRNCGQFHVSAYFTVHRPYFRMFPLDINICFRPVLGIVSRHRFSVSWF